MKAFELQIEGLPSQRFEFPAGTLVVVSWPEDRPWEEAIYFARYVAPTISALGVTVLVLPPGVVLRALPPGEQPS